MKLAKKLASVPLEYQASVYAKAKNSQYKANQDRNRENLLKLRLQLKALKEQFKTTHSEELREKPSKKLPL